MAGLDYKNLIERLPYKSHGGYSAMAFIMNILKLT